MGKTSTATERLCVLVFAVTDHWSVAAPAPDVGLTVIHGSLVVTSHTSAGSVVVKDMVPDAACEATFTSVGGVILSTPPDCCTVMDMAEPAAGVTVMVALRAFAVGLAAATYEKDPVPVPGLPVIVSQGDPEG